jgi:hypothetical protein
MAKRKRKKAEAKALKAAAPTGQSEKEMVQKAYEDAMYQNMVQCFGNSITDNQAVEHFLHGREIYLATRDKLLAAL